MKTLKILINNKESYRRHFLYQLSGLYTQRKPKEPPPTQIPSNRRSGRGAVSYFH